MGTDVHTQEQTGTELLNAFCLPHTAKLKKTLYRYICIRIFLCSTPLLLSELSDLDVNKETTEMCLNVNCHCVDAGHH